jgi:ferredoxin
MTEVLMPENYVALFRIPSRSEIDIIMRRAISRLLEISKKIGNEQSLTPSEKIGREAGAVSVADRLMSGPVNAAFYRFVISAKGFHVTEGCTGCGRCVTLCPLNNVTLRDGKPRWGSNCTHCMACICGCPRRAVEYKNKTQGKPRYFNTEEPV